MFRLKSLFSYGITVLFDNEDGGTNNTNADGGKVDASVNKSGGGGGSADDKGNKAETHTIIVDGEERNLSIDELKTLASKSAGADKRFQAAAEATKAAERGTRIDALVTSISDSDTPAEADVRELAGLLGMEPSEFMQHLKEEDPPQKAKTKQTKDADFEAQFQKEIGASPAEVRAILEHSQNRHINDARKEIRDFSDKAVDKDEIIGKMIVGEDSKEVVLAVKDMVAEDVLRKIQDGKPFGAELVAASVQRVRSQLTKLGIPKKPAQHPFLGLGPSEGFSSAIQADEPIKRVPSSEDGDEQNIVNRYLQKAAKAARQMR